MENFSAYIPTDLRFGKGCAGEIGVIARQYGKKALLIYGKGSVKKNGAYDTVVKYLKSAGISIVEYSGIKSNPVIDDVRKATKLGAESKAEMIIAVGGGSVIDSAKIISVSIPGNHDGWDIVKGKVQPSSALPLLAVLTLAATGTEMNPTGVVQNHETEEKLGYRNPFMFPRHSFLDPTFTISVPKNYTAFGIADLVAHCLEAFFAKGSAPLSDRVAVSVIQEAMEAGPLLLENLTDYELRARIMWASTLALNGYTGFGRIYNGDWGVHALGHVLSLLFDVPHGASLTIVYPAWLKYHSEKAKERIEKLGTLLFNNPSVDNTILGIEQFFVKIGCPVRLAEAGIASSAKSKIIKVMKKNSSSGTSWLLTAEDYPELLRLME